MSRSRRIAKDRRTLTKLQIMSLKLYLSSGHDFFHQLGDLVEDERFLRQYWKEWKEELMSERLAKHPGTRPAGWWWFEYEGEPWWREGGVRTPWREHQRAWLEEHGLLTPEEKTWFALHPLSDAERILTREMGRPWSQDADERAQRTLH